MIRPAPRLSPLIVLAAIAAAGWGLWSWVVWMPDEANRLRDDAFYEFVWAANFASGNGPMVSDGVCTSGVQWLWTLMLVPLAYLSPSSLPVVAPMIGLLLHVLTAALLWRMPEDRLTGIALGLCWLGHPLLLREAQNGQETALATFLLVCLYCLRRSSEAVFVLMSVLVVLARSDLFMVVLLLSLCRRRHSTTIMGWLLGLVAPLLAISALVCANLLAGGSWWQDSAWPMAWLFQTNLTEASGLWANVWWFTRPVLLGGPFATVSAFGFGLMTFQLLRPWWPMSLRAVPAILVGVASGLGGNDLLTAGVAALLLALFPAQRVRKVPCDLLALTLGLTAIIALHWALRWYPRDYYLAPVTLVAFVAIWRFGRWRFLLLVFPIFQIQDSWRIKPEPLASQREMALAGRYLHEAVPKGERVGSFNSGLVTWWSTILASDEDKRAVVNLDGVVDARSFAALKGGRMSRWLDEQGIRFVVDKPAQFELDPAVLHASGMHFGDGFDPAKDLVEIARFGVLGVASAGRFADSVRLYWRRGRGAMPARPVAPGELRRLPFADQVDGSTEPQAGVWWGAEAGQRLVFVGEDGVREVVAVADVDTAVLVAMGPSWSRLGSFEIETR